MGLFSDNHYHRHDNSTRIRYPDTIKEVKSPTDESIRLLNEFQEAALNNLISKVEVKNNLVEGTVFAFQMGCTTAALQFDIKIICKFKINGNEYVVEKGINRSDLWEGDAPNVLAEINIKLQNYANSVMLWWMCKEFVAVAYKQITNQEPPKYTLR